MKMKKNNLLILAVAALGFAACANDETTAVNEKLAESNAISFRTLVGGQMRAADVDANNGTYGLKTLGFKVFSNVYNGEGAEGANYFPETQFSWNAATSSYTSENKYYWPSAGALNFYAWSASIPSEVTHSATTKVFEVIPTALSSATSAAGQGDLVFANTNNKTKADKGATGVSINFRHAESKVILMVKNTNPNLKFTVGDVAIGNLYGSGTFTYSGGNTGTNTDTQDAGNLLFADWSRTGSQNVSYSLTMKSEASYNVLNGTTAAKAIVTTDNEMILIPQSFLALDVYSGTTAHDGDTPGSPFNGSFISAQIKIQNPTNDAYIVGAEDKYVTAMWPLPKMNLAPGFKYTFTVDLAGGGYYPDNQDTDTDLDPILEGAEIKFVDVTVDGWDDGGTNILGNVVKGGTYTFNEAADAAGTYYIYVSGLTSGSTLGATLTTPGNLSSLSIVDNAGSALATTPASGVARIKVTLAANSTQSSVPATITFSESGTATSTTVININQAAAN